MDLAGIEIILFSVYAGKFGYQPGRPDPWSRHLLATSRGFLGDEPPIQLNNFEWSILINVSMLSVYVSMGADVTV